MSKRKTKDVTETDIKELSVGSTIVLEDGSHAIVTSLIPREIEVKKQKTVYYLEYETGDKKGRKQTYASVHTDDEQVEMVPVPFNLVTYVKEWWTSRKAA